MRFRTRNPRAAGSSLREQPSEGSAAEGLDEHGCQSVVNPPVRFPDGMRSGSRHAGSPASAHVTQSAARVLSGDRRDATTLQVVVAAVERLLHTRELLEVPGNDLLQGRQDLVRCWRTDTSSTAFSSFTASRSSTRSTISTMRPRPVRASGRSGGTSSSPSGTAADTSSDRRRRYESASVSDPHRARIHPACAVRPCPGAACRHGGARPRADARHRPSAALAPPGMADRPGTGGSPLLCGVPVSDPARLPPLPWRWNSPPTHSSFTTVMPVARLETMASPSWAPCVCWLTRRNTALQTFVRRWIASGGQTSAPATTSSTNCSLDTGGRTESPGRRSDGNRPGVLGGVKTSLRRFAVLTRPARAWMPALVEATVGPIGGFVRATSGGSGAAATDAGAVIAIFGQLPVRFGRSSPGRPETIGSISAIAEATKARSQTRAPSLPAHGATAAERRLAPREVRKGALHLFRVRVPPAAAVWRSGRISAPGRFCCR